MDKWNHFIKTSRISTGFQVPAVRLLLKLIARFISSLTVAKSYVLDHKRVLKGVHMKSCCELLVTQAGCLSNYCSLATVQL